MESAKILIVDDDEVFRKTIRVPLVERGFYVHTAENAQTAIERIKESYFDLILLDLKMEGMDGLELLKEIKKISSDTVVIMITAHGTVDSAINATRLGAYDYVDKQCTMDELVYKAERALADREKSLELNRLKAEISEKYEYNNIISRNEKMKSIFGIVSDIAQTDVTVLIRGETGTGKELLAKAIHYNSFRKDKPFMVVNCAALTETLLESELFGHEKGAFTGAFKQKLGRFEIASGGTIFLDEVGDIPLPTQVKLLRVLQEKEFERVGGTEIIKTNVRIIGASNKNIEELIKAGKFREDLYYRIYVFPIYLPPLREREDDIPLLAMYFINKTCKKYNKEINGISPEVMNSMLNYEWPGNIREMENVIERAVLIEKTNILQKIDLTISGKQNGKVMDAYLFGEKIMPYNEFINNIMEEAERKYIIGLMKKYSGNIKLASENAKLDRKTIYRKIKDYGIEKEKYREKNTRLDVEKSQHEL